MTDVTTLIAPVYGAQASAAEESKHSLQNVNFTMCPEPNKNWEETWTF
jgi:hypothetical protein